MEILILICICVFVYFLPAIIAYGRDHHNSTSIFLLNLLLGWSVLGWIAAIIWAFTAVQVKQTADTL
jgi:hypothetical protein